MKLSSTYAERLLVSAMRSFGRHAALLLVVLGIFGAAAFAQEATIVGTVTDPTGAAVPNAAVTITRADTGQVRHFASNNDGQ